ncbi:hypothetical protein [Microbacterium sp. Marseille-Q6648]|uniref:hypothetical protein n=1 Tax=Microbacterium sp. Marseille-Q6648 TaxID=2937991 RepID=UPI002041E40D|nr:hypothetical protein [Microbacterium sp. Marseille-Q6648]
MSDRPEQSPTPPPGWAAPATPPFGPPPGSPATPPAAGPHGMPAGYGGPGARYAPPGMPPVATAPAAPATPALGIVSLVLALIAAVGATLVGAWAAFRIGMGAGSEIALRPMDMNVDWSVLSPVRDLVLLAEASFWIGTVLGVWALVQGVVAILRRRGRGYAIAAVVIAVFGPAIFFTAVQAALTAGFGAGSSIGG